MIQTIFDVNVEAIDEIAAHIESFNDIAFEIGQEIVDDTGRELEARLEAEPGPVQYPVEWKSPAQLRMFWATDGFGRGIGAPRSHTLSRSWEVKVERMGAGFTFTVRNPTDYAQFVVGSLARGIRNPGRFQQPFHQNTGWPLASVIVEFWLEDAGKEFAKRVFNRFGDLVKKSVAKRRATFTPRRPPE